MKSIIIALLVLPTLAQADLRIFTCEPEWAALARMIGGEQVKTDSATHALQDPHYIQARPSLISKVRRADLLVCTGAQLELGWLPMLLKKANNPKLMPGRPGNLEASRFVKRLDVATNIDRSQGDVHPLGNPHIQANPHNILLVATAMAERMAHLDAGNAAIYQQGLEVFRKNWNTAIARWEEKAGSLRGRKIIVHHKSWVYLESWLGLEEVASLEAISGVPPTAGHLAGLLRRFGDGNSIDIIIRAPFQSARPAEWLSTRTGIPAVMLPFTVGGSDQATDLFKLFDDTIERLLQALQ